MGLTMNEKQAVTRQLAVRHSEGTRAPESALLCAEAVDELFPTSDEVGREDADREHGVEDVRSGVDISPQGAGIGPHSRIGER